MIFHEVGLAEILEHSLQLSHLQLKPLNESLTLIQLVLRLLVLSGLRLQILVFAILVSQGSLKIFDGSVFLLKNCEHLLFFYFGALSLDSHSLIKQFFEIWLFLSKRLPNALKLKRLLIPEL